MKPITEILKECDEYDRLKGEATQGEWFLPKDEIKEGMNWHRLYTKEGFKGVCKPTHPIWTHHQHDATFIAHAHNWNPTDIIRHLAKAGRELALDYLTLEGQCDKAEQEIKRLKGE